MYDLTASQWNELYPVGTDVRYWPIRDEPECRDSTTRSEAWELGHGEPVVKIKGQAGGVLLSHLIVIIPK
jgi:hypothetical protein